MPRRRVSLSPADGKFKTWYKTAVAEAELFGMFYGVAHRDERVRALKDLKELHKSKRELYPLFIICLGWEQMKRAYDRDVRRQLRGLVRHCESAGTSVNSAWAFRSIRRVVLSARGSGRALEWQWPAVFVDVKSPTSHFHAVVMRRFLANSQTAALARGFADFNVQVFKRGGGVGGNEDEDALDAPSAPAAVAAAVAPSPAPTAANARTMARREREKAAKRANRAVASAEALASFELGGTTIRFGFGAAYGPAMVKYGLLRDIWTDALKQWVFLTAAERNGNRDPKVTIQCLAAACYGGCNLAEVDCSAQWADWGCKGCTHGNKLFRRQYDELAKPEYLALRIVVWRGGGAAGFEEQVQPGDVAAKLEPLVERWRTLQQGPHAAVGGASEAVEMAPGRGGRAVPAVLAEQERLPLEAKLEAALHDSVDADVRLDASSVRVPANGYGEFWDLGEAEAEEIECERVRSWLAGAAEVAAWDAELDDDAFAYVTGRCATLLLERFPEPSEVLASPSDGVALVRSALLADVARSSESGRRAWALEKGAASAAAVGGGGRAKAPVVLAVPRFPGAGHELEVVLLGEPRVAVDHGEHLVTGGGTQAEAQKCLFLATAAGLPVSAAALHGAVASEAARFIRARRAPVGEALHEPHLQARSVAHDVLSSDHKQTRLNFIFFPSRLLESREVVFVCSDAGGGMSVEILSGVKYAGDPAARSWVLCARRHAVELRMPAMDVPAFNAWCVQVGRSTGCMPQRYFMQGWANIFAGVDSFPGDVRRRPVESLGPCETCGEPHVRLESGRVAGCGDGAGGDPVLLSVSATPVAAVVGAHAQAMGALSDARERVVERAMAAAGGVGDGGAVGQATTGDLVVPPTCLASLGTVGGGSSLSAAAGAYVPAARSVKSRSRSRAASPPPSAQCGCGDGGDDGSESEMPKLVEASDDSDSGDSDTDGEVEAPAAEAASTDMTAHALRLAVGLERAPTTQQQARQRAAVVRGDAEVTRLVDRLTLTPTPSRVGACKKPRGKKQRKKAAAKKQKAQGEGADASVGDASAGRADENFRRHAQPVSPM